MSDSADFLLSARGVEHALGAWVVGVAFGREGHSCGFALGDGTVHVARLNAPEQPWVIATAHVGACLSLAADLSDGFLSGGDDGQLVRITSAGGAESIASFGTMKWVEHVAAHPGAGRAAAVGKVLHLLRDGVTARALTHPSSIGGIAFDGRGKRVACSHYNGASVWFTAARESNPRVLEWKGAHGAVAISPDGDHVVTAMQEQALHGWRISDRQHMRMSGYPAKTRSLGFTAKGRWLASSGSDSVVVWPFFGGGPMGKAPTEIAGGDGVFCTAVAVHPEHEVVAAGFADGLVLMAEIASGKIVPIAAPGRGGVSSLAWNGSGTHLAFGTETGTAGVVDLARREG